MKAFIKNRLFLPFAVCLLPLLAAAFPISDSARISLITVAPGEEVYSLFGHSALHIFEPTTGQDIVLNWGTFDFETPGFLLKFCRGKLNYFVNIERGRDFERGNLHDRRPMKEQFLNLSPDHRRQLQRLLDENLKPENRFYKYDFFFDNCSTRIRDLLEETWFHTLNFDSTQADKSLTLRDLLKPYLRSSPWTDFGIDLVLGLPADQKATAEKSMFLPDHLHDRIGATLSVGIQKLVVSEKNIPNGELLVWGNYPPPDWLTHPLSVMWFIFGLGVLSVWSPGFQVVFDRIFWFSLGLIGLVIFLLWFFTDHLATKNNLNLFWALPTHLLFSWRKARSGLAEYHAIAAAILAGLMVVFWKFLPQDLPAAGLPLALLVVVKGVTNFVRKEKMAEELA